jgi:hypothetical protein
MCQASSQTPSSSHWARRRQQVDGEGEPVGQGLPAAAVAQHPHDAFDDGAVGDRLEAATGRGLRLGQETGQQVPLLIGQLRVADMDDALAGHRHLPSGKRFRKPLAIQKLTTGQL